MKEVFRVLNQLLASRAFDAYAIGGAVGATFYVESFSTADVDIFFSVAVESSQLMSLEPLYAKLKTMGFQPKGDAVDIDGWHVQFLPVFDELTEAAVENCAVFDVEGKRVQVMKPEYLAAIALKTGRWKDFARVKMFFQQHCLDEELLQRLIGQFHLEEKWQKYKSLE